MIIISAKYPVRTDELQHWRDNFLTQAREGLILMPPGFITNYVGDDEDVVVRPYEEKGSKAVNGITMENCHEGNKVTL